MSNSPEYDWVAAAFEMAITDSDVLSDLVHAAQLDPLKGDLVDIDLAGLDLRGQNFDGWDLRYANFEGAKITGANFRNAILDAASLIKADDWQDALISDDVRLATKKLEILDLSVYEIVIPARTQNVLMLGGIHTIGDLVVQREASLLRLPMFGRKSLNDVRVALSNVGLRLSMKIFRENYSEDIGSLQTRSNFTVKEPAESTIRRRSKEIEYRALLRYKIEAGINFRQILNCRFGKSRAIAFDALSVDDREVKLLAVKELHTYSSANDLIRLTINRKGIPVIEQSSKIGMSIGLVFIFIFDFDNEITMPRLPKSAQINLIGYRRSDLSPNNETNLWKTTS